MPVLEKALQKSVVAYARALGCVAIKLTTIGRFGTSGWPDYLFIGPCARILFHEYKARGKRPTPLQENRHQELRALGCIVEVIDDAHEGKASVARWLGKPPDQQS